MDCNIKAMEFKFPSDTVHHCVYIRLSADNVEFYSTQTQTWDTAGHPLLSSSNYHQKNR